LGIAIWPPKIFSLPASRADFTSLLSKDDGLFSTAAEKEIKKGLTPEELKIVQWELATGGKYITRVGSDPIRLGGDYQGGDLIPLEAFRDYSASGESIAKRVDSVPMPLPADPADPKAKPRTLHVSLLTYEPLFDPIDECWYVDVEIGDLGLPDPFVSLSLVRYQEHSIKGLEVSEPTRVMLQVLPRRTATVKTRRKDKQYIVSIEMEGLASLDARIDPEADGEDLQILFPKERLGGDPRVAEEKVQALIERMRRPEMQPTLFMRSPGRSPSQLFHKSAGEREEVQIISGHEKNPGAWTPSAPVRKHGGLVWTYEFPPLDVDPTPTKERSFEIFVREVELRPHATLPSKPEPTLYPQVANETGPRFAASIVVPGIAQK
jgi:hypothetical protein